MSARIAGGLAVAAMLMSVAALIVAVLALTEEDAPALPAPTKYEPGAYTKLVVEKAIRRYERDGLQASIEYHNNPDNVDGQWYVFIVNDKGFTIAHHNPKFRNRDPSLRVDSTGRFYGNDLLSATEDGRWVNYFIVNPETGDDMQKHTWTVRHDGLLFASGWYER